MKTMSFKMYGRTCATITAVALLVSLSAPAAQAAVIDTFNLGTGSLTNSNMMDGAVTASAGLTDTDTETGFALTEVLGGTRQMNIPGTLAVSGTGLLAVRANPAGSGSLSFSLDADTNGSVGVVWDANGAGLGGVDLTDGGASDFFSFNIVAIDQGNVSLFLDATDTSANNESVEITGAVVGVTQFPFSGFMGVDLTSVDGLRLRIRGIDGSDLTLDQFFTSGEIQGEVPEPATLGLVGIAGLALLRRRGATS